MQDEDGLAFRPTKVAVRPLNTPQVDMSPTSNRFRAGQEARRRELQGQSIPEAVSLAGKRMEEVSEAVVLRLDGAPQVPPPASDTEGQCRGRVRVQSPT